MRTWMHILTTLVVAVKNRDYGAHAARLSINPGRRGLKPRLRSLCRVSLQQMCWYACAFFIAYCGIAQAQVAERYAQGMRAMKLGLYAEAVTAFQHVLQLNPQHAEAYCELGAAYRLQDKTNDAADAYRHALSLMASPETHGVAHVCLARIYHSQGKFAEAEKHAQNAVSLLPKSAEPFLRLGDVYVQRGKLTAAQRAYQKAIALDVSLAEGYHGAGRVAFMENRLEAAVRFYQKAIELAPYHVESHYNLAITYRKLKQMAAARTQLASFRRMKTYQEQTHRYRRMLQERPTALEPRMQLAEAHLEVGNNEEAIRTYQIAAALHPESLPLYHNLGGLYMQNGQFSEAISAFQRVLQLDKSDAEAYLHLGWLHARQRKFADAVAYLKTAIQKDVTLTPAYYGLAESYVQQGKRANAVEIYQALTRLHPTDAQAWLRLGVLHLKLEKFKEAVNAFERAIAADENAVDAYNNLAWLYASRGEELPRAARLAERAVTLEENAARLDTLAYVYYRQGEYVKAEQTIGRAIALAPNNSAYRARLKEIREAKKQ